MPIKIINQKHIAFGTILILAGVLLFPVFVLGNNCPSKTEVRGTSVTFVGELTDMGGDSVTYFWFDYGQSLSYSQKTTERALSEKGLYCITVSDLKPCTTYYYRAAARNSAGVSYGENKTFTTTCEAQAEFSVSQTIKNLSDGTAFLKSVSADPSEVLIFRIEVKAKNKSVSNLTIKDILPNGITFAGDLRIDDVLISGNILTGLNIGNLSAGQEKIITFRANVAGSEHFVFGQTELTNTVLVSSADISRSDTAKIVVSKTAVAGAVTGISTGLTDNIFLDSFFLPLIIALIVIWIFKSHIFRFEEWLDTRKMKYQEYYSNKILRLKINKIKAEEFLKKKFSRKPV